MILTRVKNEVGATAIEYGLLASLISVLAVSGMSAVGMKLSNTYCTISQHLGGSGECSGGSSKGTGGIPTGSENSTTGDEGNNSTIPTSVTTKEYMDNLKKSLKENFDDSYLDSNLGGKNGYEDYNAVPYAQDFLSTMNKYNKDHPNDQITNVFGLYDSFTKQPITSFAKASQGLNDDDSNNIYAGKNNQETLEVTTQQGHVYTVDGSGDTMSEHLVKGS